MMRLPLCKNWQRKDSPEELKGHERGRGKPGECFMEAKGTNSMFQGERSDASEDQA